MPCFGSSMKSHWSLESRWSPSTVSTRIRSRVTSTVTLLVEPGWITVSFTEVPSLPFRRRTASSSFSPSVVSPPISTIRSPANKPAR